MMIVLTFDIITSYFSENKGIMIKCSESPQASLREKANRVLTLLGGEQSGKFGNASETSAKVEKTVVDMPNLIDTGDNNDQYTTSSASPLIDDLFGGDISSSGQSTSENITDDDPFADVSFHTGNDRAQGTDLFAGMTIGENSNNTSISARSSDHFDIFGSSEPEQKQVVNDVNSLMGGLSVNENATVVNRKISTPSVLPESFFSNSSSNPGANAMFPTCAAAMPLNIPAGVTFNQLYSSQAMNNSAMAAAMANFQSLGGNLNSRNIGAGNVAGTLGGDASPIPDIFNANLQTQTATVTLSASKKEDTKAFDFISDHLAAARDPKRVI